jgi:hypothetical protein
MVPITGDRSLQLTGRIEIARPFRRKCCAVELGFGTVVIARQQALLRWPV